jgi:CheY-like chemotaxis protein
MGGDISVHSSLGKGSTFVFTIPVGVVAEEEISGSVGNLQVVGLLSNPSDYRVLIVDDQAENRLLLAKLLRQIGLDSREAASGEVALEIWQQWQPHLIWMDIRLPGLSGYDVTQHIRAQEHQRNGLDHTEHLLSSAVGYPKSSSPTVIIAVTAQAFPEDRALALAAGCDDYISKPYRIETLLRKMAEHLGMQLVYAEDKPEDDPSRLSTSHLAVAKPALTMDDLVVMPKAWLIDLQKASQLGREEAVKALIHQIPREQVGLIDKLQALIYDFEFGVIADVAEWCLQCQSMPEGPES